jgi:hypothetical protein
MVDQSPAITLKRIGRQPIEIVPPQLVLTADSFGVPQHERTGLFRMISRDSLRIEPAGELVWSVTPLRIHPDRPETLVLERTGSGGVRQTWSLTIPVNLDLTSTLDPIADTFPEPNRAAVLGDILPDRRVFERTYVGPSKLLADELFSGLYSDIVFLRREGPTRGGLCSGMARWAIARSVGDEPDPVNRAAALDRITMYHGRQLCDRAFLLGAPWFFRGSPRAAYRAVRRDLLRAGMTDRAFDVAIPKPWRRDVITALVRQGHTIVPYRIIQHGSDSATVQVYDPNRPSATLETPESVEFDLKRDRYGYRHMVSIERGDNGLVAARQSAYQRQGTAIAASLVSIAMRVGRRLGDLRRRKYPEGEPSGYEH